MLSVALGCVLRPPRAHGSIGSLALALCHKWEPRRVFVIITAYIDESGTHGGATMIMSCLVGRLGQWAQFDSKWGHHLRDNRLTYYHSKQMKHSRGEFKGWDNNRKLAFLTKAGKLTEKHTMFGITAVLGERDYVAHYINNARPREEQLDSRYGLCFRFCLLRTVDILGHMLGGRGDLDLHFVLESGHNNFGDAERIFGLYKKHGSAHMTKMLRTITAGDKKDFAGLQTADSGAYHTLSSELTRNTAPGTITIPAPTKGKTAATLGRWRHYNFIISDEKLREFKSAIMKRVEQKRARRQRATI
jgi:Protein of unknown function (DUF3800)